MTPFLISPPFGTYIGHRAAMSVLGTFTLSTRYGRTGKILQFLYDNFRYPVTDTNGKRNGYRNRIGLRNPGAAALDELSDRYVYSICGLEPVDWLALYYVLEQRPHTGRVTVELNFGCQNVESHPIPNRALDVFCTRYNTIAKLPADMSSALAIAERCAHAGVDFFHCGNTVKGQIGSLSGYPAKAVNLYICEEVAKRFPTIPIFGGGGIYEFQDLLDYQSAGATRFSLATVWLRPWRALSIIHQYEPEYALRNPAKPESRDLYADRAS